MVDNQVDQSTGTIRMKAEFPNANLQLWPGQFVNVRILIDTLKQVVVVPTPAVQRGPNGTFVYVVQPEDKVALQPSPDHQNEKEAVVANGVDPGDRVVTTGFARLKDGARVSRRGPATRAAPGAEIRARSQAGEAGRGPRRHRRGLRRRHRRILPRHRAERGIRGCLQGKPQALRDLQGGRARRRRQGGTPNVRPTASTQ